MKLARPVPRADRLLLTIAEAAQLLCVARSSLYQEVMRARIRTVKIGRSRRITYQEVLAYIRRLEDEEAAR